MKQIAILLLSAVSVQLSAFGQGSLTPPGAPAPTMKTLAQIEPRTPISAAPFTISQPGSYYLTTNLTGTSGFSGVTITVGNVTLDLNGFALLGVPGSDRGVVVSGSCTNVTVRNGSVSGWGAHGVDGFTIAGNSRNQLFERLQVSRSLGVGIYGGNASLIRDCLSYTNSSFGIYCVDGQVLDCVARDNGSYGIQCESGQIRDCVAKDNGSFGIACANGQIRDCVARGNSSYGIYCAGGQVRDCVARDNVLIGIYVAPGAVSGCLAQNNGQSGIFVDAPGSEVTGNTCIGNNTLLSTSHAGLYVNDSNNRVEGNHVSTSGVSGIKVNSNSYINNVVIKNTVSGNGASNYVGTVNNDFGPVGAAATATSPWANISH